MSEFEDKTPDFPRRIPRTLDEVVARLLAVETRHDTLKREVKGRLDTGASTIHGLKATDDELEKRVEALKEENRVKPWKVVVGVLSFVSLLAGAFMALGEYRANSKHTTDAVQSSSAKIDKLDGKVREMDKDQSVLTEKVTTIAGQVAEIKKAVVPAPQQSDFSGRRRPR